MNPPLPVQHRVAIADKSQIGEVRRLATRLGKEGGLSDTQAGNAAVVATELATNILAHAQRGEILLRKVAEADTPLLELLAIDRGPGMANVERCMADGYSTAGTPGNGLGAVKRLSAEFDIYSDAGHGTVLMSRIGERTGPTGLALGVICVPIVNETVCGDSWRFDRFEDGFSMMVVDGLGHGPSAAAAAIAALGAFDKRQDSPSQTVSAAHLRMHSTRGGAVAVARVAGEGMRYAGVGNICGSMLLDGKSQGLISNNGTVGQQMPRVQDFSYAWSPGSSLIMHSDGLGSRWQASAYPGLLSAHPSVVAGVLYRDHSRGRDDVTVAVVSGRAR